VTGDVTARRRTIPILSALVLLASVAAGIGPSGELRSTDAAPGASSVSRAGGVESLALGSTPQFGWINVTPAFGPSSASGSAMTFVPDLAAFLLLGGRPGDPSFNQTWLYAAERNNWTRVASGTASPPGRIDAAVVYATNVHQVVLFGGLGLSARGSCPRNDTWIFDPAQRTWTNATPPNSPSPRRAQAMAYDNKTHRIVLFGGLQSRCSGGIPDSTGPRLADTWLYDPLANTWTNVTYPGGPLPRSGAGLAFVPELSSSVLFGGRSDPRYQLSPVFGDTWIFDSFSFRWTELLPFNPPSTRSDMGMAYVGNAHVALLFGGCGATECSRDTWWYDPGMHEWLERSSSMGPNFAPGFAFSSDPTGLVVAFGNSSTWEYRAGAAPSLAARLWASGINETTPQTLAFHAVVTPGIPPYAYLWSFGDRATSVDPNPTHSYLVAGPYHVSLRVRDASGNSTVASLEVTVFPRFATTGGLGPVLAGASVIAIGLGLLAGWFWWKRRVRPPTQ
jgi:hypothetical protein